MSLKFLDAGESCLVVELGDRIDIALNLRVRALCLAVERAAIAGIQEAVPTYRSLAIYYDPLTIDRESLEDQIQALQGLAGSEEDHRPQVVEIPTVYGGEYGPDLDFVASYASLSHGEVIRLHTEPLYHVHMLGFTPGFAYLGGLPDRLSVPRLATPRLTVPAGSVGVADKQTGVYAIDSPGGWRIIGRTHLRLFDASRQVPTSILPGHKVRFVRIEEHEYREGASEGP